MLVHVDLQNERNGLSKSAGKEPENSFRQNRREADSFRNTVVPLTVTTVDTNSAFWEGHLDG